MEETMALIDQWYVEGSEETEKGTSSPEGLFQRQIGFLNPIGSFMAPSPADPRRYICTTFSTPDLLVCSEDRK
jgi:hypothetical protein